MKDDSNLATLESKRLLKKMTLIGWAELDWCQRHFLVG